MQTPNPVWLSIVVPVYNEEGNIQEFLRQIVPTLHRMTEAYELIFALDPSQDRTEFLLLRAREEDPRIKVLKFSRRVGQQMAILAGLQFSSGLAVIVMDVDLQDPPGLILDMLNQWQQGYEVVTAQHRTRYGEKLLERVAAFLGRKLLYGFATPPIPPNTGNFRLMSRRVVEEVTRLKERHNCLGGLVALVGFKQTCLACERPPRFPGTGKHKGFLSSFWTRWNRLISFSSTLLMMSSAAGFAIAGLSFFTGLVYALIKVLGIPFPPGNPTMVILILFMGGIQLISVGILGEYIARIHEEVKERPKFIVEQALGFEPAGQLEDTEIIEECQREDDQQAA